MYISYKNFERCIYLISSIFSNTFYLYICYFLLLLLFVNFQGASQIEGIFLDISELDKDVYLKPTFCQRMNKLRLLRIYHSQDNTKKYQVHVEALDCLPESLRYLEWYGYPLKSLPSKFDPRNLVEIKMPYSQLEHLWHGSMVCLLTFVLFNNNLSR